MQVFSAPVRNSEGWTSYTHPRGWLYFRHGQRRIVTDEDVRLPEVYANLSRPCSELHPFGDIPTDCEVHILSSTPGRRMTILVDHGQCHATPLGDASESHDDLVPPTSVSARKPRIFLRKSSSCNELLSATPTKTVLELCTKSSCAYPAVSTCICGNKGCTASSRTG